MKYEISITTAIEKKHKQENNDQSINWSHKKNTSNEPFS